MITDIAQRTPKTQTDSSITQQLSYPITLLPEKPFNHTQINEVICLTSLRLHLKDTVNERMIKDYRVMVLQNEGIRPLHPMMLSTYY